MKKSISFFLDRDGIINELLPGDYVKNLDEFVFRTDFLEEIQYLSQIAHYIIIITNQQGIGKDIMSIEALQTIHDHLIEETKNIGGRIDAIYFCPHLKENACDCRKPKLGMIEQAFKDFPDLKKDLLILVGDSASDIEVAKATCMVAVGLKHPKLTDPFNLNRPDYQIESLNQLRTAILPKIMQSNI